MVERRTVRFAALLLLCFSASALAQQNTTSASSSSSPHATPNRNAEITIRGCVSGGKRYTFVQASTGAMFALTEETTEETSKETTGKTTRQTDRFARVQGKLIEVTANEFPPQGKSNELPKLQVKRLRVIANKCPAVHRTTSTGTSPCLANQKPNVPATSPSTKPYVDPGTETQTPPSENNPNIAGDSGAPSPGTGNPPCPPQ